MVNSAASDEVLEKIESDDGGDGWCDDPCGDLKPLPIEESDGGDDSSIFFEGKENCKNDLSLQDSQKIVEEISSINASTDLVDDNVALSSSTDVVNEVMSDEEAVTLALIPTEQGVEVVTPAVTPLVTEVVTLDELKGEIEYHRTRLCKEQRSSPEHCRE